MTIPKGAPKGAILVCGLTLLLGGCAHMSLAEVSDFLDRVNAGIESVDAFAHKFCPSAQVVGVSAKTLACTAKANGTTQHVVNAAMDWGQAFCANPTSKSLAQLTVHTTQGIRAILAADAAGCTLEP